jgi:hypothetical protein
MRLSLDSKRGGFWCIQYPWVNTYARSVLHIHTRINLSDHLEKYRNK